MVYVIFSALYAPHMGGVESYVAGLAHELASRGDRVVVATSRLSRSDPAHVMQPDGVEVVRLPCLSLMGSRLPVPLRNVEYANMLDQLALVHPDRVILNNHFYGMTVDGVRFALRCKAQAIMIEHGSNYLTLGNPAADEAIHRYEHHMASRVGRYGVSCVGVSAKASEWMKTFGYESVGIVANAIDAAEYAKQASGRDWRYELGLEEGDILIASVGRLVPEKGVRALLDAAAIIADGRATSVANGRKCLFAFAGDGPMIDEVRAGGACTVALGRLASDDTAALLRDCDAYALPSRSEGFATTLLESCAMAAFPIATDVGGVEELGIGSCGGMVLPDGEPETVVAAVELLAERREASREEGRLLQDHVLSSNTWRATVDALDSCFERAADLVDADAAGGGGEHGDDAFEGDERLDQLHRVLLMMMKDFADICEREGITWIASYGTAIGAFRHGSFIPWDDDIDICMLRPDLERLVEAVRADKSGKYAIVDAQSYPGYPLATTRFVLNGTEFRDSSLATMDFPSGIFLDLFPLDSLADGKFAFIGQAVGSWLFNKLAIAKMTGDPHIVYDGVLGAAMGGAAKAARTVMNAPAIRNLDPNDAALWIVARERGSATKRVGYVFDTLPTADIYDRDDLFPLRWVPFEDMMVPVAHRAEKLLTDFYGDWMTPISADKRKAHYPDILDFGEYAAI